MFNRKHQWWNSSIVSSQGKFEQNMWCVYAYFADKAEVKQHVEKLIADTFPVSGAKKRIKEQAGQQQKHPLKWMPINQLLLLSRAWELPSCKIP
ncbi:hypothetical protein KZX50_11445 [Bacillus infantis]|uniref:hypothetical protein n=1 Tax=Bacillus infantis TaxID=324767 RepID=UPI000B9A6867|nr:hypothetical protein [Bacillus infantis]MCK6206057.1 hypothetical protein [Bacillus infantis]OXT16764.1 hypothetical protein B9K06_13795 [Bacillus sp. OG2]